MKKLTIPQFINRVCVLKGVNQREFFESQTVDVMDVKKLITVSLHTIHNVPIVNFYQNLGYTNPSSNNGLKTRISSRRYAQYIKEAKALKLDTVKILNID